MKAFQLDDVTCERTVNTERIQTLTTCKSTSKGGRPCIYPHATCSPHKRVHIHIYMFILGRIIVNKSMIHIGSRVT